jgi:hypothetical protein
VLFLASIFSRALHEIGERFRDSDFVSTLDLRDTVIPLSVRAFVAVVSTFVGGSLASY